MLGNGVHTCWNLTAISEIDGSNFLWQGHSLRLILFWYLFSRQPPSRVGSVRGENIHTAICLRLDAWQTLSGHLKCKCKGAGVVVFCYLYKGLDIYKALFVLVSYYLNIFKIGLIGILIKRTVCIIFFSSNRVLILLKMNVSYPIEWNLVQYIA